MRGQTAQLDFATTCCRFDVLRNDSLPHGRAALPPCPPSSIEPMASTVRVGQDSPRTACVKPANTLVVADGRTTGGREASFDHKGSHQYVDAEYS